MTNQNRHNEIERGGKYLTKEMGWIHGHESNRKVRNFSDFNGNH